MWFQNFYDTFYKCFIKEDRYQLLLDGIGVTAVSYTHLTLPTNSLV